MTAQREVDMWQFGRCSDKEGLRLMLAFLQIDDPDVRRSIIEVAENLAENSRPVVRPPPPLPQDNRPKA